MQNVGKALEIMDKLECWLENDIDELYGLRNEAMYLNAVEVRGH